MRILAGRYELGARLGRGGMASVVEARDTVLDRRVAVKLVRADLASDPEVRARLLREARSAASLTHHGAVRVYDIGDDGGEPFIVMEHVGGESLAQRLAREGPLDIGEALRVAGAVLGALGAAHRAGLVHRDVKPGNVLLSERGEVKLTDFGIAKGLRETGAALTATGEVLGTPHYLAPEQTAGEAATPRTDVYAVGVLLYEMLSGAPPFDGDDPLAVARAHQEQPVPPLAARRPEVPAAVAAAVHRALEKDPADRFPGAEELRAALGAGAADPALVAVNAGASASPPGAHDDPAPPARRARTRWPAVGAGAMLALLAALLAAALGGAGGAGAPPADADRPSPGAGVSEATLPPWAVAGSATPASPTPTARPTHTPTPAPTPTPTVTRVVRRDGAPLPDSPTEALAALAEDLETYPGAAGERSDDLAEEIEDLLDKGGRPREKDIHRLADRVEDWMEDGELDDDVGGYVLEQLDALLDDLDDGPGQGRGRGRGHGRGD